MQLTASGCGPWHALPVARVRAAYLTVAWGAISLCIGGMSGSGLAGGPGPAGLAGERLLAQLDLSRPDMDAVRRAREAGNPTAALKAWRDAVVIRLRKADLGQFDYHDFQLNGRRTLCDFLVGKLSTERYRAETAQPRFEDLYGMAGSPRPHKPINWLAASPDPVVADASEYGTFSFAIPLVAAYWRTQDAGYLEKWFSLATDYALYQRQAMETLPEPERPRRNSPWVAAGDTCLYQAQKVTILLRSLGGLAKSLPAGDGSRPAAWRIVLSPLDKPAAADALRLFEPEQLAAIVLSLTDDDPGFLLELYEKSRAPPNQRCQGLASLLMLVALFPEVQGMDAVGRRAGDGMVDHMERSFHRDGGMMEQALNYNLTDAERLRQMGRMMRSSRPAWLSLLAERLSLFDRMLVALRTPAGELPVVGNNTSNPPALWESAAARSAWFEKQGGRAPVVNPGRLGFTSVAFPYSGYYVQRSGWDWASHYLFFMNARPAAGHATMDNLGLEIQAFGRPMLVRGGPPFYNLKFLSKAHHGNADAVSKYFGEHSSFKINTVIVDGLSQVRAAEWATTPSDTVIPTRWHSSRHFDYVEGLYDLGYGERGKPETYVQGISHHRQVIYERSQGFWVVVDRIRSKDNQQHRYSQIWKLPPRVSSAEAGPPNVSGFTRDQIVVEPNGFHTLDPGGPNLWAFQSASEQFGNVLHWGETNPYRGWYARQLGDLQPAADIHSEHMFVGDGIAVTVLWPVRDDARPCGGLPSRPGTSRAALELVSMQNQTTWVAASAREGDLLEAGPVRAHASLLLAVADRDELRGLVLDCTEFSVSDQSLQPVSQDFEFRCRQNKVVATLPIQLPRGFRWVNEAEGSVPLYDD